MPDKKTYQRPVAIQHVISSAEATATQADVTILSGVASSQTTDPLSFTISCRTDADGTEKSGGLKAVYSQSGSLVGSLRVSNGTASLAADDILDIVGMFQSSD